MEAIKLLEPYFLQLKGFLLHAQYCVERSIHAPDCRDFWTDTVIAIFAVAFLLTLVIVKRMISEQLELHRNRKRLEARKMVADEATMREHQIDL
jgi:hypothetical protein